MADETPSVRESLTASIAALESTGGSAPDPAGGTAPAPAGAPDSAAGDPPSPPAGGSPYEPPPTQQPTAPEAPRSGELPPPDRQQAPQIGGQQQGAPKPRAPAPGDAPQQQLRPPAAWSPEVREKWAGLPPEVQREVIRRERVIARGLEESAEARRGVQQFMQICQPYQHLIAMEGGNPLAAFGDYLKTNALLRTGTPAQKAQALAHVVDMFGVDVRLLDGMLAQVISGAIPPAMPLPQPQQTQQYGPQEFRDPRVDQMIAAREQEADAQASEQVEDFYADAKHEFLPDVRHDMADILDVAASRGRRMSLEEAYNAACLMHPKISKIVEQRRLAGAANTQNRALAGKQAAAGSVTPSGGASNSPNGNKAPSVREAIEQSIAQLSS